MSEEKKRAAESIKRALKGEMDGYKFYDLISKKASNPQAKRLLEGLRDDEIRHQEVLHQIWEKYIGGEMGELPEKGITPLAEVFRKGQLDNRKTEMDFIALAIEAELAATKYYQEERDLFDDPSFRDLFDRMAEEEHGHYELLQSEKDALAGNYSWFSWDEGSPMEH